MTVEQTLCGHTIRYQPLIARTADGLTISVQDHGGGNGGRDILFIHGFSQSSLCWLKQVSGPLRSTHRLVTYDMRGHGASDKPIVPACYRDPARWADEVQTVIETAGLDRPLIVCWSYAGRVTLDFLSHASGNAIAGLVMVAATCCADRSVLGPATPRLRAMAAASDMAENIVATQSLLDICTFAPVAADERTMMLGYNLLTPPPVRLAMSGREANYDATLAALEVPLLAIHGRHDQINLPEMSAYSIARAPRSMLQLYDQSGHMPFWEESSRFDRDLGLFANDLRLSDVAATP